MKATFHNVQQRSDEWFALRKGRITGSKFKTARDKLKSGAPSGKAILYARDVARERMGGTAQQVYQNAAMRIGVEQEPLARMAYETQTGYMVQEVGFATTDCGMFGLSPDGLIDDDGVLEVKTMVGSDNLFKTVIEGDYSEYLDQCLGYLLFLDREWVDLVLWTPDLEQAGLGLVIHRITRADHEKDLAALKHDLDAFADVVKGLETKLREKAASNVKALSQFLPEEPTMTAHQEAVNQEVFALELVDF
jgi:exodeoxyribonuclease (lambda-induced)